MLPDVDADAEPELELAPDPAFAEQLTHSDRPLLMPSFWQGLSTGQRDFAVKLFPMLPVLWDSDVLPDDVDSVLLTALQMD